MAPKPSSTILSTWIASIEVEHWLSKEEYRIQNLFHLDSLPNPTKNEAVFKEIVCGDHQDGAAIDGRPEDSQPFL